MKYIIDVNDDKLKALNALGIKTTEFKEEAIEKDAWPKEGDLCYYITFEGKIDSYQWYPEEIGSCFNNQISIGNMYKTKEEVEFALERLKVLHELSKYTTTNLSMPNDYYILEYKPLFNKLEPSKMLRLRVGQKLPCVYIGALVFETSEKAQEAIDAIGQSRIMTYLGNIPNYYDYNI